MKRFFRTFLVIIPVFIITVFFTFVFSEENILSNKRDPNSNCIVPIRSLVNSKEIKWYPNTKSVVVRKNDIEYSFLLNSDNSIDLIKDNVVYGSFKPEEARLIQETDTSINPNYYLSIQPEIFEKYFCDSSDLDLELIKEEIHKNISSYNKNISIYKTTDEELTSSALKKIQYLEHLYGNLINNNVPQAEAELIRKLDSSVKDHGIRVIPFHNKFNTEDVINKISSLYPALIKQSNELSIKKELISSVIFREMMCYSLEDDWVGSTKGIAQISTRWARENEIIINEADKFDNLTDKELDKMIQDENESVYFAAMALKARAKKHDIQLDSDKSEDITKIFESYNGFEGYGFVIGSFRLKITFGPIKHKVTYGKQTYEYYEAFSDYYNTIDDNYIQQ